MEQEVENKAGEHRDEQGRFVKGFSGNPEGLKPMTEEDKLKKKAQKIMIENYVAKLTGALQELSPVLIKKAKGGDMIAIKELHDRAMGKAQQHIDVKSDGKQIIPLAGFNYVKPADVKPTSDNPDNQTPPETG